MASIRVPGSFITIFILLLVRDKSYIWLRASPMSTSSIVFMALDFFSMDFMRSLSCISLMPSGEDSHKRSAALSELTPARSTPHTAGFLVSTSSMCSERKAYSADSPLMVLSVSLPFFQCLKWKSRTASFASCSASAQCSSSGLNSLRADLSASLSGLVISSFRVVIFSPSVHVEKKISRVHCLLECLYLHLLRLLHKALGGGLVFCDHLLFHIIVLLPQRVGLLRQPWP
jgi:hypothetical protein